MAPTTTRDAVEAPKIEIALTIILGKDYFEHVEESGKGNDSELKEFLMETRLKAFDWIVNQDPMHLDYNAPNLVQRFLLVLFYYQTTRHKPWRECNPPAGPQMSANSGFCYEPFFFTGEATSTIWGDQWLSASHECQWAGITCQKMQPAKMQVTELRLSWNQLNGPLPWEIAHLSRLTNLQLGDNMLTGALPGSLLSDSLELLESLSLSHNQISGPIPLAWIESIHEGITKLTSLWIASNRLTGTIPSEIGLLPLKELRLHDNALTGDIPKEVFKQSSLWRLNLGTNDLAGTLPSEVGLLTNLEYLEVNSTRISGPIPSEIGLATLLNEITLSNTNLQGTIPEEIYSQLENLKFLALNNCNFSGTISSSVVLLTYLEWLHLANNRFHGTIPNEIEALTGLRQLLVNRNELTGTVPVSVCQNLAYTDNWRYLDKLAADCLPNPETGVPVIQCPSDCCTSCCDETGLCLAN
ncbi:receptor-like protein kinase precursor [Seminavis robusta]|uniref:Receptor-like protein kinase n=1 Tax=Seminavis robusta TaxID=568900 RepID=A0A9N8DME5_9STRA|nr:receptor-like protein kinase precursor [Seminavis robusta]|eukprot:Sro223_g091450.1 receptor-like protein kinase precursor (469) ;mRNA; f:67574-69151